MTDRLVLVACNLKSSKIAGFVSAGMVLAAKGDGRVELVDPPPGSLVGERVFVEGLVGEPVSPAQVKKRKVFEEVAKKLLVGEDGVVAWDGGALQTSKGDCRVATLVNAPVS